MGDEARCQTCKQDVDLTEAGYLKRHRHPSRQAGVEEPWCIGAGKLPATTQYQQERMGTWNPIEPVPGVWAWMAPDGLRVYSSREDGLDFMNRVMPGMVWFSEAFQELGSRPMHDDQRLFYVALDRKR